MRSSRRLAPASIDRCHRPRGHSGPGRGPHPPPGGGPDVLEGDTLKLSGARPRSRASNPSPGDPTDGGAACQEPCCRLATRPGSARSRAGLRRLGYELYATGSTLKAIVDSARRRATRVRADGIPRDDGRSHQDSAPWRPCRAAGAAGQARAHGSVRAWAQGDRPALLQPLSVRGDGERPDATFEDAVEQIDIGGPAMIRAAAKNSRFGGGRRPAGALRRDPHRAARRRRRTSRCAAGWRRRRIAHTAAYDAWIAAYMRARQAEFPTEMSIAGRLARAAQVRRERAPAGRLLSLRSRPGRLWGRAAAAGQGARLQQHPGRVGGIAAGQRLRPAGRGDREAHEPVRPCDRGRHRDRLPDGIRMRPDLSLRRNRGREPAVGSRDSGADRPDRDARGHRARGAR